MPDSRFSEQPSSTQLLCSITDWQEGKHRRECTWTASPGVRGYAITNVYLSGEKQRWRNERVKKIIWSHTVSLSKERSREISNLKIFFAQVNLILQLMEQIRWNITQILTKLLIHLSWAETVAQQGVQPRFSVTAPDISDHQGQLLEPCQNRAAVWWRCGESASTEPDDGKATWPPRLFSEPSDRK